MRHRIILDFLGEKKKKKKKKEGIFGHFWGPLARGPPDLPDDWNDGTLKFSLAALADVPYPLIFFACGAIFLFCSAKKGLLSDCVSHCGCKPAFLHRTLFFFRLRRHLFFFHTVSGRKVQDQVPY